jgi:hypothetical protein
MTDQAFNTREGDTLSPQGDNYLENVFSSDVASAEIVAQCDVLTLGRMQRDAHACTDDNTHRLHPTTILRLCQVDDP